VKANNFKLSCILAILFLLYKQPAFAYSIFTHVAIIDASWEKSIQPLLLLKYPGATKEQLKEAHAFAYGGAIAPDIGYFPFGKPVFTDLIHYVRSGDFVNALLDDAQNLDEYAFALGFLCHYMADKYGHSLATNRCVPMVYPGEKKKYGDNVTYEDDPVAHKRMEFGFDVLQTVEGNYASDAYHDFIGFQVSRPLLERAFSETYGLDIHDVFGDIDLSIETLRWSFRSLFPALTKAAWIIKRKEILQAHPDATRSHFIYKLHRANYYHEFRRKRERPGLFSGLLSLFIRIVPKVGPLRALRFKAPGPAAEKLFIGSFDTVLVNYRTALNTCRSGPADLANIDFDTGNPTIPGEYGLADKNYDLLLVNLEKNEFRLLNPALRRNILDYYSGRHAPEGSPKRLRAWSKTTEELQLLRHAATVDPASGADNSTSPTSNFIIPAGDPVRLR
jgi:hypothetical protein